MNHESDYITITSANMKNTITTEDVTIVAQKFTNDKLTRVLDYNIGEYSKEILGFSASHEILKIKFQRSNANEPESASFFVKAIPYDFQIKVDLLAANGTFLKESNFYRRVIPELHENRKFEQWYPKCYLAKKDAMILDDLKAQNYKLIDTLDNLIALKSALVSLAQLHGLSILMEARLNCNSERYITVNEYYSGMFDETLFVDKTVVTNALCSFFDVSCAVAQNFGYDPDEFRRESYRLFDVVKQSKTYRNVICHGDLWCNNMMFNDDQEKCILFDFQWARYAPLGIDLLQFLHLNTSRSFRKANEIELIEFYHSALNRMIKENDTTESVKVPTIGEIFAEMNDLRLVGLVTALFYFPAILINPKVIAEYGQDAKTYKSFLLDNKVEQLLAYMKIDERYKSRIEEAVIELAEYVDLLPNCK